MTLARARADSRPAVDRPHQGDGAATEDHPATANFRLIAEGQGSPMTGAFPSGVPNRPLTPYKLFERVEGAVLRVEGPPDTVVTSALDVQIPGRRHFVHRSQTRTDGAGIGRLRVPYATGAGGRIRTEAQYRIRLGDAVLFARVSEEDVTSGAVVRVGSRRSRAIR